MGIRHGGSIRGRRHRHRGIGEDRVSRRRSVRRKRNLTVEARMSDSSMREVRGNVQRKRCRAPSASDFPLGSISTNRKRRWRSRYARNAMTTRRNRTCGCAWQYRGKDTTRKNDVTTTRKSRNGLCAQALMEPPGFPSRRPHQDSCGYRVRPRTRSTTLSQRALRLGDEPELRIIMVRKKELRDRRGQKSTCREKPRNYSSIQRKRIFPALHCEGNEIFVTKNLKLKGHSALIELPLPSSYAPAVYASVCAVSSKNFPKR